MLISYELDGKVALLGLNRPEKRNAMSEALLGALHAAVVRAGEEADAAVLFGHGVNFCAGLDLGERLQQLESATPPPRKRRFGQWHATFDLIARGAIPFVAALHGMTIGGGLEMAAAAHIRVADETTVFGLPEGQRGIFVGGGGTVRVQRLCGYAVMADMMLTGRLLSATEGRAAGFAQYLVPPGEALAKAKALAQRIAENLPLTNWQITNLLPRINDLSHDDGLFVEALNSAIPRGPEAEQRLRDFVQKRARPLRAPEPD